MEEQNYYWVVTCKNVEFHKQKNPFSGHRIALAKTEVGAPHPDHIGRLSVVCDECGKQFAYESADVLMWLGTPASFTPYPAFDAYSTINKSFVSPNARRREPMCLDTWDVVPKFRRTKMAVTYKVTQQHSGGNHSAIFIEDAVSQKEIGRAVWDPARAQFCFSPDSHDIALSAADAAAIVVILNGLSR